MAEHKDDGKRDNSNDRNGASGDNGDAIDGADVGPVGDGDGTSIGDGGRTGDGTGDDASGTGADAGSSGIGDAGNVGDAGGDLGTAIGNESEIRGDSGNAPRRRGRPRKRDGNSRATGASGNRTGGGSQNVADSELDNLGSQKEPRSVSDKELGLDADISKLSKSEIEEALAGLLQGVFVMIAGATKHEHWNLTDKESVELARAAWNYIKTLPTKQNKRFEKWLKEHAPLIKVAMVSLAILGPRFSVSLQLLKIERLEKENERLRTSGTVGVGNGSGIEFVSDDFIS